MSTKDNLENIARNTWLAGLGSIDSSKDALSKSIDAAQEKSNNLYNELQSRGEVIQHQINDKKDEIQHKINDKKNEIQAKGKKLLGMGSEISDEEKLIQLNASVDQLASVITQLVEARATQAKTASKNTSTAKTEGKGKKSVPEDAPKSATATKATKSPKTAKQAKTTKKTEAVTKNTEK